MNKEDLLNKETLKNPFCAIPSIDTGRDEGIKIIIV
jgi:hypothetical protein